MKKLALLGSVLFVVLAFSLSASGDDKAQMPDSELNKLLAGAQKTLSTLKDYTCIFHKQEMVKGKLLPAETMTVKFRAPRSIYMKWIKDPHEGRETLYIEGKNDNEVRAHEGGFLKGIKLNLDPKGSTAMAGNRHPVTEFGLDLLVKMINDLLKKAMTAGDLKVYNLGTETLYGRPTIKVEGVLPQDKAKGYYCYRAIINFDTGINLPIRVQIFDWDNKLIEDYGFDQLKLNPGLTDVDFDSDNKDYAL